MQKEESFPTFSRSEIYGGLAVPQTFTVTRLLFYEMFKVWLIARINQSMGHQGIVNIPLRSDAFPYWLA